MNDEGYVILNGELYEIERVENRGTIDFDDTYGYGFLQLAVKWKKEADE